MKSLKCVILIFCLGVFKASAQSGLPPDNPANPRGPGPDLETAEGLVVLDYQSVPMSNRDQFDLLGVHYLHRINDWFYAGLGISGPMVEGNYGGFFVVDTTLHARKRLSDDWFLDAGIALGGGGGGSSITGIKDLSGTGGYSKAYVGLAREFETHVLGVSYSYLSMKDSPIGGGAANIYLQKPVSFAIGPFDRAGSRLSSVDRELRRNDSILTLEYGTLRQIDPSGLYKGDIGLISPQFSQFFNENGYAFFGFDFGATGLIWYNQIQGGVGRAYSMTPRLRLYGQLGLGSGGWVTNRIETGPGLLLFPKARMEYLATETLGASLSLGYLVAPKGDSRNLTVGAALNYHLRPRDLGAGVAIMPRDWSLVGLRFSLLQRLLFDVEHNGLSINDLDLRTNQLDYFVSDQWYLPFQISVATNDYAGYAGYVEALGGLGWQSRGFFEDKFRVYGQILTGLNDVGVNETYDVGMIVTGSTGFSYDWTDRFSLRGELGRTVSLGQYTRPGNDNYFENYSIGLGVTYRFSLPFQ